MRQPAHVGVRPAIQHVPHSVVRDAHERIVRCGLGIVPVSSETEDKFEDPMEVTASSRLVEIARVEIRSTTHLSIGVEGSNTNNSCFIGQIFNAKSPGGSAVFIDANDRLGTITSSKRFKDDIQQMGAASETLFALKPITFHYKRRLIQPGKSQFGLVAEEVEKVNPDLVMRDKEGKPYSVRYDQVNAMLLNEFLKKHRKVEEQEATIAQVKSNAAKQEVTITELKSGMQALTATVREQASQIQKSERTA